MPTARSKTAKASAEPDFVLKHRVVGAAFLLFFGALVLPWLLGTPDTMDETESVTVANAAELQTQSDPEADLLAAIESELPEAEDQVYISKITPLDADQQDQTDNTIERNPEPRSSSTSGTDSRPAEANDEDADVAVVDEQVEREQASIGTAETVATEGASDRASQPAIDVGWIVQVGVFTDQNGAARVVSDLRAKGFDPSTTVVDTNRGKATGTRIWLGPYAQRVDAAKAKTELTSKTGEAGFIRAYP